LAEFKIAETDTFLKEFSSLQRKTVYKKISNYVYPQIIENPFYGLNIKKLKRNLSGTYRYRIGDYRLFYEIDAEKKIVVILSIKDRKDSYK